MLTYFPKIYKDEIFSSIIARYYKASGNTSISQTSKELFGVKSVKSNSVDFPTHIGCVTSQLETGISTEEIIAKNTLYPIFLCTMNRSDRRKITKLVCERSWTGVKVELKNSPAHQLRYCPKCAKHEFESYNEAYFHRIHQVPYIQFCPTHLCYLYDYPKTEKNQYNYVVIEEEKVSDEDRYFDVNNKVNKLGVDLVNICEFLFEKYFKYINKSDIMLDIRNKVYKHVWSGKKFHSVYNFISQNMEYYYLDKPLSSSALIRSAYDDLYSTSYSNPYKLLLAIYYMEGDKFENYMEDLEERGREYYEKGKIESEQAERRKREI